jgi:predicted amidophosphoribosyltransferase
MALKAVVFGLEGTFVADNSKLDQPISADRLRTVGSALKEFIAFLQVKEIKPIIVANHHRDVVSPNTNQSQPVDEWLNTLLGEHSLYIAERDGMPYKSQPAFMEAVLDRERLSNIEVVYVGTSQKDFLAALHARILFLNAQWVRSESKYGFVFSEPVELMRFIDLFALKEHHWFYRIDTPIEYRSLGPFSTMVESYAEYSAAAREAAKQGTTERHFFLNTLVASLYFSGEIERIDYIACVPGHEVGYGNPAMNDVLTMLGQIFNKKYIPDLIVRHSAAPSQRAERQQRRDPGPDNQLNSIHLTKLPLKKPTERYKSPVPLKGKRVLLFDDFTTKGYSMEAARLFLAQAGASVTAVSWLKTINRPYTVLSVARTFNPFRPQTFQRDEIIGQALQYEQYIGDRSAADELTTALRRFRDYGRGP